MTSIQEMTIEEVKGMMDKQICPVCKTPVIKNNKATHSKTKEKICENLIKEKFNVVRAEKIVLEDGKELEMRAQMMTKEEAQKGFRAGRIISS